MKRIEEAIEFIKSESVKEHLKELVKRDQFELTDEEMCSIVWNGDADINMKQTFFMNYPELPVAIDMIKRFEAVRYYLQDIHEHEIFVLLINNVMSGVYYRFDQAKEDYKDMKDTISENAEIFIEMYDPRESAFRGRIELDHNFDIKSFDFSLAVIKDNDMWNNADTDRVANMYIRLPHPFMEGDIVTVSGSIETYRVVNAELPEIDIIAEEYDELYIDDMQIEVVPYDEDAEEDEIMSSEDEKIFLPLLSTEFAD